jgi:hypothetical protein
MIEQGIMELGAGIAGMIIVIQMMIASQRQLMEKVIDANTATTKSVVDAIMILRAEVNELSASVNNLRADK